MKNLYVYSVLYGLGQITNDPPFNKKKQQYTGNIDIKWLERSGTAKYTVKGVPIGGTYPTLQILKHSNWQTYQMDLYFGIKK